ncbi:peptidoglycan DD-metalloendopeptidase family protein [Sphingomonas sp. PL-96]|uniref:peptidoglycan DD-metalloendopeptidase family protein n=1 Tax=Sphingomonas sp. PL-96 TaxID=2887201 RepID=UPI001E5C79BC|nr:peptidoglycan DD-metalloendopeptidase family protein [Sphingomonas sp. PL-96]MCC2976475.1 peptidoglycan DD-metalloendopeptidase family protein [Sphingomonas sp. PL-96]
MIGQRACCRTLSLVALGLLAGCIPGGGQQRVPSHEVAGPPDDRGAEPQSEGVTAPPTAPPAWEVNRVVADARTVAQATHVVARGDTLRAIANRTGAGSEAIARANGLAPPFTIYPGQKLSIPGGRYHLVREGQTGIAIARAYAIPWSQIVSANGLEEPFILRTGQRILIPGGAATASMSVAERAAAFRLDIDDILTGGEPAIEPEDKPARATASPSRVLPPGAAVAAPARLTSRFQWPVTGSLVKRFGAGESGERNNGINIAVPTGTPVLAAADGVVAYAGTGVPGLGGVVILKHGDRYTTVYGNAKELLVQRGQAVKRGQQVASSGETGYADRPQLHFEIREGRAPVDPLTKLPRR